MLEKKLLLLPTITTAADANMAVTISLDSGLTANFPEFLLLG